MDRSERVTGVAAPTTRRCADCGHLLSMARQRCWACGAEPPVEPGVWERLRSQVSRMLER